MTLVLTRADVTRLLTIEECIDAVEEAFQLHGQRAVPPPGVLGTYLSGGGFHIKTGVMPADGRTYFVAKTNANFPHNPTSRALPTIQGVIVLFDAECGTPLAIMDSIEITRLRTAAASAVAARRLARQNAATLTIIGCGSQSSAQADALLVVLPIRTIHAFDIDRRRAAAFAADMEQRHGVTATVVDDFAAVTRQSDVVVTCTTSRMPFLRPEHIAAGTFVAAIGADSEDKQELDSRLLIGNHVVADVLAQAAAMGEIHHALDAGLLDLQSAGSELGAIVAGRAPGRGSEDEITIFDSTGMALQDAAAACAIYRKASRDQTLLRVPLNA